MDPQSVVDADFYEKVAIAVVGGFFGAVISTVLGYLEANTKNEEGLRKSSNLCLLI
jgi:hypothetical protein